MNAKQITFGKVAVLVMPSKASDVPVTPLRGRKASGKTIETASKLSPSLTATIAAVAEDIGKHIRTIAKAVQPDEIEVEVKLGLAEGSDLWIINVKSEQSIAVKLKWRSEQPE